MATVEQTTTTHSQAQQKIAAQTALQLIALWRSVDTANVDADVDRWLAAAAQVVLGSRSKSQRLSRRYMTDVKRLQMPDAPVFSPNPVPVDLEKLRTSLLVTGPYRFKTAVGNGMTIGEANLVAESGTAGAGVRHALNGGRDFVAASIRGDRTCVGYARITDADPCHFCLMLASREAVYKRGSFENSAPRFQGDDFAGCSRVHDMCACTMQPIYRSGAEDPELPESSQRAADLWREYGGSGKNAAKTFRNNLAQLKREQNSDPASE